MKKIKILVFSSGSKDGGASGLQAMIEQIKERNYNLEICGVVTQHPNGGAMMYAKEHGIPYIVTPEGIDMRNHESQEVIDEYSRAFHRFSPDFTMLSGWVFRIPAQFCSKYMLNIHPGLMMEGVDAGKCGIAVHQSLLDLYKETGAITCTAVNIHWVTPQYDEKLASIAEFKVPILDSDTAKTLQQRVGRTEHAVQTHVLHWYANEGHRSFVA